MTKGEKQKALDKIAAEIEHGKTHLRNQSEVIDPKIIVLLGSVAAQGVLDEKIPINKMHGQVFERNGKKYLLMFHPSAALRLAFSLSVGYTKIAMESIIIAPTI